MTDDRNPHEKVADAYNNLSVAMRELSLAISQMENAKRTLAYTQQKVDQCEEALKEAMDAA